MGDILSNLKRDFARHSVWTQRYAWAMSWKQPLPVARILPKPGPRIVRKHGPFVVTIIVGILDSLFSWPRFFFLD